MKMIVAIIDENLRQLVSQALINANFRVTQLATTSGFLRGGETSLLIGVNDHQVGDALDLIRNEIPEAPVSDKKQATIYVLNVRNVIRL